MPTTFHTPKNHVSTAITASRSAGAAVLEVADGSVFGAAFPLIATAVRGGAILCILEITGRVGNTLTVSGAIEGTTDAALVAGDRIEMRPTALAMTEIQDAVHALEADVTDLVALEASTVYSTGSFADPSWIASLAGAKVSGDIAGNAASITGSVAEGQVTGLTGALAAKADDAAVVHNAGDEAIAGVKTFSGSIKVGSAGTSGIGSDGRVFAGGVPDAALPENIKIVASDATDSFFGAAVGAKICWIEYYSVSDCGILDAFDYAAGVGKPLVIGGNATPVYLGSNNKIIGKCSETEGLILGGIPDIAGGPGQLPGTVARLTIVAAPGQTANVVEVRSGDGNDTLLAGVAADGKITGDGSTLTGLTQGQISGLTADLAAKALDSAVVHTSGDETIAGVKTFTHTSTESNSSPLVVSGTNATADLYQVGSVIASFTDTTTADSTASGSFIYWANYTKTGPSNIVGFNQGCYWGQAQVQAGIVNVLDIYNGRCDVSSGATVTTLCHYKADSAFATAGTVSARHGFHVNDFFSPCVNQYGVYVDPLTTGTGLNYAVYTAGATPSYFGGPITANGGISGDGSGLSGVVHSSGDEIVAGAKTFSGAVILSLAPQLPTLADAAAPDNSLFFGSDHLDGSGHARLCRKQSGTTTPIG